MSKFVYKKFIKPILFLFPADIVHILILKEGSILGKCKLGRFIVNKLFYYKNSSLSQNILNINFENPIGLAAGFDYNAELIDIIPNVGFGYHTVGTITQLPYIGNPKPMLGRLPKSKSLLVNKGFKNNGIDKIINKLQNQKNKSIPLGISIGSTNRIYKNTEEMVEDIYSAFSKVLNEKIFDYYELNISCPNLINIENLKEKLDDSLGLSILLNKLSYLNIQKPLFIKMPSEKGVDKTIKLVEIAEKYKWVSGFIFSNLVKDRSNKYFNKEEIEKAGKGNFSGAPVRELANELISEVYKVYKDRFIIIGCGGIFSGKDAYEMIKRGATLIQLITSMIYEGPSQIKCINKELVKLLKADGYKNIKDAVGVSTSPTCG